MQRRHVMPFGAQMLPGGGVRFRIWAPSVERVELLFAAPEGATVSRDLHPQAGGWFELETGAAGAGTLYRFRIDGSVEVPDPASRFNPRDVHGPSMVVDPAAFDWPDADWRGRRWHEAVIYELHVGAFSEHGSFAGIERRLDQLARLGVTALELMPLADFPGRRNWGYDGVLWFAPDASYGSPEDLKRLVASAHARGLMVLLDVVYNHFGPEGNYLHRYAPQFFSAQHQTPWGGAINFDGQDARNVRDFVIHNALYWLDEYHCDGLRIDAVHAIHDDSTPDILSELEAAVRSGPGRERHVHLVLENDANQARYLGGVGHGGFDAQWNDDEHHCLHVIATGERDGYYEDYAAQPHALLQRCLTEGFAYQGEPSRHRDGARRGEPSGGLPPTAFVPFLQNHDQVGNRAAGERLPHLVAEDAPLRALTALLLLAPSPPLLFMGEEWHASQPFPYFCDFEPELAEKVRAGRRREFARFHRFAQQNEAWTLPDPGAPATFDSARLRWGEAREHGHSNWLTLYRRLLRLRHREIIPRLPGVQPGTSTFRADGALGVAWQLGDGSRLQLLANLSDRPAALPIRPRGRLVYSTHPRVHAMLGQAALAPWTTIWLLGQGRD